MIWASRCYEWGEKFARFAKERDVEIAIEHLGGEERNISFAANSANQPIEKFCWLFRLYELTN